VNSGIIHPGFLLIRMDLGDLVSVEPEKIRDFALER